jgi:hypothetical protein
VRGLVALGVVVGMSTVIVLILWRTGRAFGIAVAAQMRCDFCMCLTPIGTIHIHHHEPGCGIDDPSIEHCRCAFVLCPACCDCDLVRLLEDTDA